MTPPLNVKGAVERWVNAVRMDGWINMFTGLGNALRDKTRATVFGAGRHLDDATLESLFTDNDLASRVCDAVPEEMMRPGFQLTCEDSRKASDVMRRWGELEAHTRIVEGMTWGRLFGGGAVYVGVEDGLDESAPLDLTKVKRVDFLTALDRRELHVETLYDNPRAPKYGRPQHYRFITQHTNPSGKLLDQYLVHESRLIVFGGALTTNWQRRQLRYWDNSVLQRVHEVLQQFGTSWDSVAHLMSDIAQAVYKMKGLAGYMETGQDEIVQKRMEMMELGRSVVRAIVLDAEEEDFERKHTPLTDVPDVMRLFMLRFAAAARMPATIAFAQSPAGLNATGDSDMRWWYNTLDSDRENKLKPKMMELFRVLWAEQGGEPKTWGIRFKSFWEPTETESATIRKSQAETDKIYFEMGAVLPEEIALSRFGEHGWSSETHIDLEARREMLEASIERAKELAKNPPEPPKPGEDPDADPEPDPDAE
jgi:phage-related protein (TIGR01555 family)